MYSEGRPFVLVREHVSLIQYTYTLYITIIWAENGGVYTRTTSLSGNRIYTYTHSAIMAKIHIYIWYCMYVYIYVCVYSMFVYRIEVHSVSVHIQYTHTYNNNMIQRARAAELYCPREM